MSQDEIRELEDLEERARQGHAVSLAAENGDTESFDLRNKVALRMDKNSMIKAKKLAQEYLEKYGTNP